MTMRYFFGLIGLVLIGVSVSAQTQKGKAQIMFTVEGVPVTTDEFLYLYRKNHQGKPDEFQEKKIKEYLGLFINFKLKVAEARTRGLDTTKAFINEFNSYRDELRKPYVASADELGRLVKEAYDRLTLEVNASHILFMVSPDAPPGDTLAAHKKAETIRKRILAGEPFEKLARELSEDPSAKQNAGSLGYFTAMQMVYPFESAAYKLNPGEVSGPVRTRFGYHLIKLLDKKPASGEVEVSHILLRGTEEKVKNKAFDIYEQLKGGRKWEDLCNEYSEDPATKGSGGRLRVFGVGALATVPEFEAMAFSLQQPGDISDPFSSAIGWHIIRLEKKIPVPSFKDLEASLKRRIARDERLQLGQAAQLAKRKRDFLLEANEDTRSHLAALADSTLQKGDWRAAKEGQHANEILLTIQGKDVYVAEFYSYVKANQRQSAASPQACYQQLLDQFADRQISDREDIKLQTENSEYRNLLNEYYEGILLFSIMEKEVWNKSSEDTVGQRIFYEQNAAKYKAGERLSARIFATADKPFLEEVKAKISKGDTLTAAEMKRFKSVGNYRAYEKGDNKAIDQVSWSIGIHETEADGMYYLVEADRLIPSGIKRFEDARASVISDYQDQLEGKWVAELRKRHPVKVNKKVVKKVIAELVKK